MTNSTGSMVNVPHGIGKLFVQDTVSVSDPNGLLDSLANTFIQRPRVPEPSALLGLGLLGLGGLISKTRRRG
ncbi:PEP-CTERM sorting domain-containing protein [Microcystis aeruginosa]|uniref:PEP-CTERM sorting domain-containing protein n=1 Tax=Microcystis aeruginosa TaxID=1126 RepID=UPI001561BA6B|nr:PEP-CTERM sorting domain-containing protein [Microcystis aeruginosa]